jgi:hypothetical protein
MNLQEVQADISDSIVRIDASRIALNPKFQLGVGPYGEPQLVKLIVRHLNELPKYHGTARTRRTPDLLIPREWAIEVKIARPYGDNGLEAENWSVNLLHPYPGNVSTIGDCYKLVGLQCHERKGVLAIGYEHNPPKISLMALVAAFEAIEKHVAGISLSARVECVRDGLIHRVHQSVRVFAWEVMGIAPDTAFDLQQEGYSKSERAGGSSRAVCGGF